MENPNKAAGLNPLNLPNGIFVRGIVVSNRAKLIKRKDGSGFTVIVEHEIALQPGVVLWVRYFDPATDKAVKVEGGEVTDFPRLKELVPVTVRALSTRSDERTGQLSIKSGELIV